MKKNELEIKRLKGILEKDKLFSADKFEELFYADLSGLLKDYFEIAGDPMVNIEKLKGGYSVSVSFNAKSVKNFNSVLQ